MELSLINGSFSKKDALHLLSQFVATKIQYHENKIDTSSNEEDIKNRERKIQGLQNALADLRKEMEGIAEDTVSISGAINILY